MMGPRARSVKAKRRLGWARPGAPRPFSDLNLQTAVIVDNFLGRILGVDFG